MARDFSNPNKLGFMRVIQVLFAINVVFSIAILSFIVKTNFELNFDQTLDMANLLFDGVSFWLIWQRKRSARWFIIGFSLFNIVIGTSYELIVGSFDLGLQLFSCSFDIILFLYFLTSRRVKAVLTKPFSATCDYDSSKGEANYYQPKKWSFWRNLIIYFCVFSVVGHWMEAAYCTLIRFGILPGIYDPTSLIWTEWLYPFCVYGFGAVACILILYPLKNLLQKKIKIPFVALLLSFTINALVCTSIELTMGLILNQPLADGTLPLWDYRNMFCNFMGQVCLQNAIAFGLVATLMTWVIYPGLEKLLAKVPRDIMNVSFVVTVIGFCILFFLYCINIWLPSVDEPEDQNDGAPAIEQPADIPSDDEGNSPKDQSSTDDGSS